MKTAQNAVEVTAFKQAFLDNLRHALGRTLETATPHDRYFALALTVRSRLLDRWSRSIQVFQAPDTRVACYLSAEYLLGPHLICALINLGALDEARQAMKELGLDFDVLAAIEEEPGLGNGGLGRLAACYLESMATTQIPAVGYGIRYEFGIFDQAIKDGAQVEITDKWLRHGNPWEIPRPEIAYPVGFGGRTEPWTDHEGRRRIRWHPDKVLRGVAYDTPIPGYRVGNVTLLRLFSAEAVESFDFAAFNVGDYYGAVEKKVASETLTKVLYPNDEGLAGKTLRLQQQYFFVSCALRDMLRVHHQAGLEVAKFHHSVVVQLNDTHPAVGVAELMRLLVDQHAMEWEAAWGITREVFAYTNHTLLPEALEAWSVELFGKVLPRHLEIVYEINRRFLEEVRGRFPGDEARAQRMSIIADEGERRVRMAHLATVGGRAINGVAALHSALLKTTVLRDFHEMWPDKFKNVTNGVTPRRFMVAANPALTGLLDEVLGAGWPGNLERLSDLEPLADDPAFRERWRKIKDANRHALAREIEQRTGTAVDPAALMDVQVKRIHEYKRQHLNVLHVVALYRRLKSDPRLDLPPRTVLFAGKAAPGYVMAKRIIRLIHRVGEVVNADPETRDRLRVVFLPDYNVKHSMRIFPGADLSEQISTAGKEASGTGNMKFALNGALTIGTLDGANVEIRECVGADNFFLFGRTVEEVARLQREGYRPAAFVEKDDELREVLEALGSGAFARGDQAELQPVVDNLLHEDPFLVLADFRAYVDCQRAVETAWRNREGWTRASILNVARTAFFSSDRSIRDYAREIWAVKPVPVAE
ncbi:MAG TPA: glycogen/starch/alpha-glucan phosphorylase [Candidatus Polarisedimenticolaceae bacterium]|nr:glycogen/starch/alpha-glucan phosphorylase [Candidatus Polarisedimenticolaceae bacterium]